MTKKLIFQENLKMFTKEGSMGVVVDERFSMCFWPTNDEPFSPFAEGSKGIEVQGPPTPRNIIFPPDTVFLNVLINETREGSKGPTYRTSEIPTGNTFYKVEEVVENVIENVDAGIEVEVEQGHKIRVPYTKTVTTRKLNRRYTDLTKEEAIQRVIARNGSIIR